jgi:hypothetical protein
MRFSRRMVPFILTLSINVLGLSDICVAQTAPSTAHILRLGQYIKAYNLKTQQESTEDGSYRGEAGILRITPEVGRSLGLKVLQTREYLAAAMLYTEAEALLKEAIAALRTRVPEKVPGEHAQQAARLALRHKQAMKTAREDMMAYRSQLSPELDDRLKEDVCAAQMKNLLQVALAGRSFNLREGLGAFYNRCQDVDEGSSLNVQNIKFVNYVFHEFVQTTPKEELEGYDLDRCSPEDADRYGPLWTEGALGKSNAYFAADLEAAFEKHRARGYPVDILLFMALMRQESSFEPRSVSYAGAAGLTQIMPSTARELGMRIIFEPPYYKRAAELLALERRLRTEASQLLLEATEDTAIAHATVGREKMQYAFECKKEREELYARYRRELLDEGTDDRLNARKAIEFGLKYFSELMQIQDGDISLALASYNAGPHRVRQYNGLPPYDETINFRNRVINYYRQYRATARRLSENSALNQR